MSKTKSSQQGSPAQGAATEGLDLVRRIRHGLRACSQDAAAQEGGQIDYLWLYLSRNGSVPSSSAEGLGKEQWLNVIDEAASLGVKWLVISSTASFSKMPFVWELCAWAQDTHGMMVGLHTSAAEISAGEVEQIRRLDPEKTRVLVLASNMERMRHLETQGITIDVADEGDKHAHAKNTTCRKPGNMVFVNELGVLYTCGLVEGNPDYCLGDVFRGSLQQIMTDPNLPHNVPQTVRHVEHGCDGCPPLMGPCLTDEGEEEA